MTKRKRPNKKSVSIPPKPRQQPPTMGTQRIPVAFPEAAADLEKLRAKKAMMDDAQKRAADFNTEQRIAELEAEIRRLRKTLPDRLKAMFDQAEADGLYEALDVTPEQVRNVELEAELADKDAEIARLRRALKDLETRFVNALADDAAAHPEKLGDVGELIKGDDELLEPPTKTPREQRHEIIRKAGEKDRKVLDRLRDHDKKP